MVSSRSVTAAASTRWRTRRASGVSTVLRWRKRVFRCAESACERGTFSEEHELIRPRAKLTSRAIGWATDAREPAPQDLLRYYYCAIVGAELASGRPDV